MKSTTYIAVLRKQASELCNDLAERLDENPDDVWQTAGEHKFIPESWGKEELGSDIGVDFWEAYIVLHAEERAALNSFAELSACPA